MKQKITITYWWQDPNSEDAVNDADKEALEEAATSRINEMAPEGYTSGELIEEDINGTYYCGWWNLTKEVIA